MDKQKFKERVEKRLATLMKNCQYIDLETAYAIIAMEIHIHNCKRSIKHMKEGFIGAEFTGGKGGDLMDCTLYTFFELGFHPDYDNELEPSVEDPNPKGDFNV